MANILGITGYNKSGSSVNKLLAAYGNDIIDVSTGLGTGQLLTSSNNVEFETFLDRVFFMNNSDRPRSYDGTAWTTKHLKRAPIGKYIKKFRSRLFLGNCSFPGPQAPLDNNSNPIKYPSRIFYSDLLVGENLTWGIEWGNNAETRISRDFFEIDSEFGDIVQDFKETNIKIGDPLIITGAPVSDATAREKLISPQRPWLVSSIEGPYRLKTTIPINLVTIDSIHYWVGSNWFDVGTDNNDQITGLSENSDRLLIFKLMSLWFYTGSQLKQIKDAVGTSSNRSIINKNGYTYYFHGSHPLKTGIYRYDGVSSVRISKPIEPFIRGMSASSYDDVVAWEEGDEIRFYLGTLTNTNYDISMSNAVATLHTGTSAWDVSPIADTITCATGYRTANQEDIYCGTSDDQVLKMVYGNNHNTNPIRLLLESKIYYPAGTDIINEFPRIQIIGRKIRGIKVKYKLWDKPETVDERWRPLGELSNDKTELELPKTANQSAGIQLQFSELGNLKNDTFIEKITIFYKPQYTRMVKHG